MKKYLISLDKDSHRRELFFSQPNTQDFKVFSAINTMSESEESLKKRFHLDKFLQKYGRSVTKGEIGCTLSHLAVYQLITEDSEIKEDEFCLICEDDVLFNQRFQENLETILTSNINGDILLLGQSKIFAFNDIELEITYPTTFSFLRNKQGIDNFSICYPYKNYYAGTVAYLIRKSAARAFLSHTMAQPAYWLADDFILFGSQFNLDIQIVRPLMAIENPTLNSNLQATRGSENHPLWQKLLKYPIKKLLAVKRNLGK